MLTHLTLLLSLQLVGEIIVAWTGLPLPGPVVGMALLFVGLTFRGGLPEGLERTAQGLLQHLSLLFVPAGVGIMLHLSLVRAEWLPITASIIGSTVLTIAVTALVMAAMVRLTDKSAGGQRR
jgi:holin-like protein